LEIENSTLKIKCYRGLFFHVYSRKIIVSIGNNTYVVWKK